MAEQDEEKYDLAPVSEVSSEISSVSSDDENYDDVRKDHRIKKRLQQDDAKAEKGGYFQAEIDSYIEDNFQKNNIENNDQDKAETDTTILVGSTILDDDLSTNLNKLIIDLPDSCDLKNKTVMVPIAQAQQPSKLFGKYNSIFGWKPQWLFKPRNHFTLLKLKFNNQGELEKSEHIDSKRKGVFIRYDLEPLKKAIDRACPPQETEFTVYAAGDEHNEILQSTNYEFLTKYTGKQGVFDSKHCGVYVLTEIKQAIEGKSSQETPNKKYQQTFRQIKDTLDPNRENDHKAQQSIVNARIDGSHVEGQSQTHQRDQGHSLLTPAQKATDTSLHYIDLDNANSNSKNKSIEQSISDFQKRLSQDSSTQKPPLLKRKNKNKQPHISSQR